MYLLRLDIPNNYGSGFIKVKKGRLQFIYFVKTHCNHIKILYIYYHLSPVPSSMKRGLEEGWVGNWG